ncbi:hypothetical protein EJ110_NYTH05283 [Nymphaea thermarum]|nr:hypothetical protein EJ110_NYTH05283 [Nymphaea thermarum]
MAPARLSHAMLHIRHSSLLPVLCNTKKKRKKGAWASNRSRRASVAATQGKKGEQGGSAARIQQFWRASVGRWATTDFRSSYRDPPAATHDVGSTAVRQASGGAAACKPSSGKRVGSGPKLVGGVGHPSIAEMSVGPFAKLATIECWREKKKNIRLPKRDADTSSARIVATSLSEDGGNLGPLEVMEVEGRAKIVISEKDGTQMEVECRSWLKFGYVPGYCLSLSISMEHVVLKLEFVSQPLDEEISAANKESAFMTKKTETRKHSQGTWRQYGETETVMCRDGKVVYGTKSVFQFYHSGGTPSSWFVTEYSLDKVYRIQHKLTKKPEYVVCKLEFVPQPEDEGSSSEP